MDVARYKRISAAAKAAMHEGMMGRRHEASVSISGSPDNIRLFWEAVASAAIRSFEGKDGGQ